MPDLKLLRFAYISKIFQASSKIEIVIYAYPTIVFGQKYIWLGSISIETGIIRNVSNIELK